MCVCVCIYIYIYIYIYISAQTLTSRIGKNLNYFICENIYNAYTIHILAKNTSLMTTTHPQIEKY